MDKMIIVYKNKLNGKYHRFNLFPDSYEVEDLDKADKYDINTGFTTTSSVDLYERVYYKEEQKKIRKLKLIKLNQKKLK